ncbi:dihydroorotase [Geosporobacter subterraneus DSM 17957]|uniref:Dihydroorotase n=1 Tax=Geosporobacter subterraneus DSM 17957 TaxID=1121919 RepID=A0A1M6L8P1_9FIRM|nr:dihydroorotase [Geosporobacter subterraneus]SHJ67524.1 dihydroorotase [Geosporobacter subterraneus DSM 17957]
MTILIKGGWIVDPSQKINEPMDILVSEGKIERIEKDIDVRGCEVFDARGKYVTPGLIDMHVHFREPGFEQKETIETGARAAVAGGFSTAVCMPNTNPVIDNLKTAAFIKEKASRAACNVLMMGSITKNLDGKEKSPYRELQEGGIVGITDDGKTVMNAGVLYEAMAEAAALNLLVSSHCEDIHLVYDRSIHRGEVSKQLNLMGIPAIAEEIIIQRDLMLAEATGARLHIQHISTKKGVDLVRQAKKKGIKVSAEAAPHHFLLWDEAVLKHGTMAKMSPPLRTKEDVEGIIQGLLDGTIDVIATDHAPHTEKDKDQDLIYAANGIIGLETALGIALTALVHERGMTLTQLVECMSCKPAKLLNIPGGTLAAGSPADITIMDIHREWTVDEKQMYSKARNMPFHGLKLQGKAICTIVKGVVKYTEA